MRITTDLPPAAHREFIDARRDGSRLWRFIHWGGSLQLAMILLVTIALACAIATFAESRFDGEIARHYIYKAPWFLVWLGVLAFNLFCVTLTRWPWRREHLGFVITHYGIITLLAGAVLGRLYGFEGFMNLATGVPQDRVVLNQSVIEVAGARTGRLYEIPLSPEVRAPSEAHPWILPVPENDNLNLRFDGYAAHLATQEKLIAGTGEPGVALRLQSGMMGQELSLVLLQHETRNLFNLAQIGWEKPTSALPALQLFPPQHSQVPYKLWRNGKIVSSGLLALHQPLPLGWADWQAVLTGVEDHAARQNSFVPGNNPEDAAGVRVTLLESGVSQWIPSGEEREFITPMGLPLRIDFGLKTRPLPFAVTLLRFDVPRDEGTATPSDFIATVRFDSATHHAIGQAHMNYPASFPGGLWRSMLGWNYKFSQASWDPQDLNQTTLQVLYDPGWPLKWIGSLLVVAGVFILFYLKPKS